MAFNPTTPACYIDLKNTPLILHEESYPIEKGLEALFPTLLGNEGMKYYEIQTGSANGKIAKSDKPLRVSYFNYIRLPHQFSIAWLRT